MLVGDRGKLSGRQGAHAGRLIDTVESGRFDPLPLITHRFGLDDIVEAYELFSNWREGVLMVAVSP